MAERYSWNLKFSMSMRLCYDQNLRIIFVLSISCSPSNYINLLAYPSSSLNISPELLLCSCTLAGSESKTGRKSRQGLSLMKSPINGGQVFLNHHGLQIMIITRTNARREVAQLMLIHKKHLSFYFHFEFICSSSLHHSHMLEQDL